MRSVSTIALLFLLFVESVSAQVITCDVDPRVVKAYSYITNSTNICISWPSNFWRTNMFIMRRVYTNKPSAWTSFTGLYSDTSATAPNAGQYVDTTVTNAVSYEYLVGSAVTNWICGATTNPPTLDFQYINAGINVPLNDSRGNVELLIESNVQSSISAQLTTLTNDLIGDGYKIFSHVVAANDVTNGSTWFTAVTNTKALVVTDYNTDPNSDWTLFIIGHVPIPYSGDSSPGGHVDNVGAHPADWYYADTNSANWTDSTVNDSSASFSSMFNTPGDGKWDQSNVPGIPNMRVGRIDLYGMSSFTQTYAQLLTQYLNRDHQWRNAQLTVRQRTLLITNGTPFEALNIANSYFGSLTNLDLGQWFFAATNSANTYLFGYGTGSGEYDRDNNVGFNTNVNIGQQTAYTTNWAQTPIYIAFDSTFGSYYGDWDSGIHSNVLQAILANAGYGLTETYRENMLNVDETSMGEPIGQELYSTVANFNVSFSNRYLQKGVFAGGVWNTNTFAWHCYCSLHGDPTLKTRIVIPPTNALQQVDGGDRVIFWSPSTDSNLQGYHVYRAPTNNLNSWVRVTTVPTNSPYRETPPSGTNYVYWVRAVKLEQPGLPARTFYNASAASFTSGMHTNYYVSTNGLDSHPGTFASPFLTIQKALNVAQAGDMIFAAIGNYAENDTSAHSGSAGNPIIVDGQGVATNWSFLTTNPYLTFQNWTIAGKTSASSWSFWMGKAAHFTIISNCVFDGRYMTNQQSQIRWDNPIPGTETPFGGNCASGCLVISNEIKNTMGTVCVQAYGDTNVFWGNFLHDQDATDWWHIWGRSNYLAANYCSNMFVSGLNNNHPDALQFDGGSGAGSWNLVVESNIFLNIWNAGAIATLEGHDCANCFTNIVIRNNFWSNVWGHASVAMPNVSFYNNDFINCNNYSVDINNNTNGDGIITLSWTTGEWTNTFQNPKGTYTNYNWSTGTGGRCYGNVFFNCGGTNTGTGWYNFDPDLTNVGVGEVSADFNYVAKTNNQTVPTDSLHRGVGGAPGWGRFLWWETNGINGGYAQFNSTNTGDYSVGTNSFLYNASTNLNSLYYPVGFSTDIRGVIRPTSGNWTIGAFEAGTSAPSPPPPATFILTVASSNPSSGVTVTLSPTSNDSVSSGSTSFTATYTSNTTVTATAPGTAGAGYFNQWQQDGSNYTNNVAASFVMGSAHTMTAVYTNIPVPGVPGVVLGSGVKLNSGARIGN